MKAVFVLAVLLLAGAANAQKGGSFSVVVSKSGKSADSNTTSETANPSAAPNPSAPEAPAPAPAMGKGAYVSSLISGKAAAKQSFFSSLMSIFSSKGKGTVTKAPAPAPTETANPSAPETANPSAPETANPSAPAEGAPAEAPAPASKSVVITVSKPTISIGKSGSAGSSGPSDSSKATASKVGGTVTSGKGFGGMTVNKPATTISLGKGRKML